MGSNASLKIVNFPTRYASPTWAPRISIGIIITWTHSIRPLICVTSIHRYIIAGLAGPTECPIWDSVSMHTCRGDIIHDSDNNKNIAKTTHIKSIKNQYPFGRLCPRPWNTLSVVTLLRHYSQWSQCSVSDPVPFLAVCPNNKNVTI